MQDSRIENVLLNISRTSCLPHSWTHPSNTKADYRSNLFKHSHLIRPSLSARTICQHTNMSDQKQAPADANVGWEGLKSDKGKEYRVKASDYDIAAKPAGEEANSVAASGPEFSNVTVDWTVGSSGAPSPDIQNKTGITWYKLENAEWYSPFQYKLTINCNDTYDYHFMDQEGDSYQLDVRQTAGSHSLEYRSSAPTIVSISGY